MIIGVIMGTFEFLPSSASGWSAVLPDGAWSKKQSRLHSCWKISVR